MLIAPLFLLGLTIRQEQIRWVEDEPLAVLRILQSDRPTEADWSALFETEGYRRLKEREAGMGRTFANEDFRAFVSSPELKAGAGKLVQALDKLRGTDFAGLGRRALAYLPRDAKLKASVYPLIKPKTNSFVWDTEKDPAIMLYLDPAQSAENVKVTISHELHHIGYSSCCPSKAFTKWVDSRPKPTQDAWMWVGAFGEGYAVLAAADGPNADPVSSFPTDVAQSFREGVQNQGSEMVKLQAFFRDVLAAKLVGDEQTKVAMEFYGVLGPWYSIGYVQAVNIERAFGRPTLLRCYQDPRLLMSTYNRAVDKLGSKLPKWPDFFLKKLAGA